MVASNIDLSELEGFNWDDGNLEHINKHRVEDKECEEIFFNQPFILTEDLTHSQIEERFRVYGKTDKNRLLLIIFTIRDHKIRIVSARDQNKKERDEFQGGEDL